MTPTVGYADFGPMLASVDVDYGVIDRLKMWLPTYLGQLELVRDLGYRLARPKGRSFANAIDPERQWPDHELPAILVATARTQGTPEHRSDGSVTAEWLVAVSAIVRGQNGRQTRELASLYELAIRMIMLQDKGLGGLASGRVRWVRGGEARPMQDPTGTGRFLAEGASQFVVPTDNVTNDSLGPREVDDSYEPFPAVAATTFDVEVPLS